MISDYDLRAIQETFKEMRFEIDTLKERVDKLTGVE